MGIRTNYGNSVNVDTAQFESRITTAESNVLNHTSQLADMVNGQYKAYYDELINISDNHLYYIKTDGTMANLGSPTGDKFYINEYPVVAGEKYNLIGDNVSLLGNYPIAGFKTTSGVSGTLTIIQNGTTIATDYNIEYTPSQNGYIFIAEIIDKEKLRLYKEKYTVKTALEGKTWVAYGDSITAGYNLNFHLTEPNGNNYVNSYVKRVANKNNMTFYNYGTSGRGYSVGGSYKLIDTLNTYGKVADADIVSIAMGTNDYGLVVDAASDVPFGAMSDVAGALTFVGYVKQAIARAQQLYPNSAIVVFTPIVRPTLLSPNYQNKTLLDYADAIKNIAISYGCYVGDILSKCRFNMEVSAWKDTYMTDRLHPTQLCVDEYLTKIFENELINAIK